MQKEPRTKSIVFTVNNWTERIYSLILNFARQHATYAIIGKEIGYESELPKPNILSDLDNFWFWGATGTGKTSKAFSKFGESLYIKTRNKWWCEYHGEETVLIDEVDESDATWMGTFLKNWADRYPFRAEVKRSSILIRPLRIVVTSNWSIKELWPEKRDHEALLRKFQAVHFKPFK